MFLYGQKVFAVKLPIRISVYEKTLTEKSPYGQLVCLWVNRPSKILTFGLIFGTQARPDLGPIYLITCLHAALFDRLLASTERACILAMDS